MKLTLITLVLIVITNMNVHAVKKTITTNDFIIQYEECTEKYAKASLKILKIVKSNAVKMGFPLSKKIELDIVKSNKCLLYVRVDNPNLITWEFKSMNDFRAPQKSGYNNVYGLCHEMGHVCMGNITPRYNWMTKDYEEGWANYFGCLMIEHVYKDLGEKAWPDKHDYYRFTGMSAFKTELKGKIFKDCPGFIYCSSFWYNLSLRIGKNNISNFLYTINLSDVNSFNCEIKFINILKSYKLDKIFIADFKRKKDYLLNTTNK